MFSIQRQFVRVDDGAHDYARISDRNLWAEVLWRAYQDYQAYQVERKLHYFADAQLAKMWIEDFSYYRYSFEWACEAAYLPDENLVDAVKSKLRLIVSKPLTDEEGNEVMIYSLTRKYPKRDHLSRELLLAKQSVLENSQLIVNAPS